MKNRVNDQEEKRKEILKYLREIDGMLITAQDEIYRLDDFIFSSKWHFLNEAFQRVKLAERLLDVS